MLASGLQGNRRRAHLIFVRCDSDGSWLVQPEGSAQPVSRHREEREAERSAVRYARANGGGYIVLGGRYRGSAAR